MANIEENYSLLGYNKAYEYLLKTLSRESPIWFQISVPFHITSIYSSITR
jgi:hypothetical protein